MDAPLGMRAGMTMLAAACLAIGVIPGPFLEWIVAVSDGLIAGASAPEEVAAAGSVAIWAGIAVLAAAALPLLWRSRRRITPIWACGLPSLTTRMQYTATAFSKPIRSVFTTVYKPERKLDVLPNAYAPVSISYHSVRTTSWEKSLYRPIVEGVVGVASQLRRLQTGNIQGYLLYIFLTLIALLAFVGWRR
jgi:NADH:ubiquinone oxidoreductase subunit 5 (subunit L)/multisubunit Na+/H+ antiporter MnhA subunit